MDLDVERWTVDTVLADGGTVLVRPIDPGDGPLLADFHGRQSRESVYFRFFSPRPHLPADEIERLVNVDGTHRMAFVAVQGDGLVGVARYGPITSTGQHEIAFFTDDEHRGRGIATVLLEFLAARAKEVGITVFTATVLPENRRMARVFRAAGYQVESHFDDGVLEFVLGLDDSPEVLEAIDRRAITAEKQAVARLLAPHSIAVVGAGRTPGGVGHRVLQNLLRAGFTGAVYPVNPEAYAVAGVRAHATVTDIPDRIDLAIVCVPADRVPDVIDDCAEARVRAAAVISAGFSEIGDAGRELEEDVLRRARRSGLRILGPNSLGVVNTDPAISMHATFAAIDPLPGHVGILSQSGTLGAVILERARQVGLGVSSFVAAGNKADLSGNDVLQHWADDERTSVLALYLESFGNPRRFSRTVQRVARNKPVFAVRAGASRLPADHDTGWLDDQTIDGLLRQNGVVRVGTLDEMLDAARVAATQPVPTGSRVAVVGNSAGAATMAADACVRGGLELAILHGGLRHDASLDDYRDALRAAVAEAGADVILVCHAPYDPSGVPGFLQLLDELRLDHPDTVLAASVFAAHPPRTDGGVPVFDFPDDAAAALADLVRHGEWRRRAGAGSAPSSVDVEAVRQAVARRVGDRTVILSDDTTRAMLRSGGMELPTTELRDDSVPIGVTVTVHPVAGPLVEVRRGGVAAYGERILRTVPLGPLDIEELLEPLHLDEVADDSVAVRLGQFLADLSAIVEGVPEIHLIEAARASVAPGHLAVADLMLRVGPERLGAPDVRHLGPARR